MEACGRISRDRRLGDVIAETGAGRRRGLVYTSRSEARRLQSGRSLLLIKIGVFLDELLLLFRHIFERVNRVGGASGNACAAVNAAFGIDIHLGRGLEGGLVLLGMDAIGRANFNTEGVFNARIGNYIGHDESVSWNEHFRLAQDQSKRGGGKWAVILITCWCASARNQLTTELFLGATAKPRFMMIEITKNCDGGHRNTHATGLD